MAAHDRIYGLHIPAKGKTYVYDFRVGGERYNRSTRKTRYADALKVAAAVHQDALTGERTTTQRRLPDMPLREVFGRYYNEKASLLKSAPGILSQLTRMAHMLGPDLPLSRLTLGDLMDYQVKRRRQGVANRTVNYEVPELIRPVIKRARKWGIEIGPLGKLSDSEWSELKLPLPAPRTRSATRDELAKLLRCVRKDYRPIVMFARLSGLRKTAQMLKRSNIDWDHMILTYPKKSKLTGDVGHLPITRRMARLLRNEIRRGGPDCEWVFTYDQLRRGRGRSPITSAGYKSEMQRAVKRAGLEDWRIIHDLRHTAATETLRASQNLAAVQQMMGHSNIAQTRNYAHVLNDDVRRAMEMSSNVKVP